MTSGFDLNCVVQDDSRTVLILVLNAPLIVLYFVVESS